MGIAAASGRWPRPAGLLQAVPPPVLLLTGAVSVQFGAGLAGRLFGHVPPAAVTGLRLWSSAILMAALTGRGTGRTVRDVIRDRAWRDGAVVVLFGVILGVMNFSIYQSFARIPLGIAVTIEFLGPLALAVATSRRAIDLLWVSLAGAGVLLLASGGTTTASGSAEASGGTPTIVAGVIFALIAAASWAAYILLSRATGRRFAGSSGLTIAMVVAAVAVTPAAVATGSSQALRLPVLGIGILIGLLSSVIPYGFELEVLRRVPARVFGIWMSLEPAVAALIGLLLLSESLAAREWAAVGCVMAACAGSARSGAAEAPAGPVPPPG